MRGGQDWQNLVPGNLPTRHLSLSFRDFNPAHSLAGFAFTNFVKIDRLASGPQMLVCYLDPLSAAKVIAGRNHYGPVYEIGLGAETIEFEDYAYDAGPCQDTAMNLLAQLMLDLRLACRWEAYSWYYDNHEYSESCTGSEKELCELFTPDPG